MKRKLFTTIVLLIVFVFSCFSGGAQEIWSEDFSSDSQYSVTLGAEGEDGSSDYFIRTDDITGFNIGPSYTNKDGFFFAGQDIDDTGWIGSANPSELTWINIDISGKSNLEFKCKFASAATAKIDDNDYLHVLYKIDAGNWTNLLWFENDGTEFNTAFLEDADFDGDGEGTQLNSAFVEFTKGITGTGSLISFRISCAANSGGEDFAFDDLILNGSSGSFDPEPTNHPTSFTATTNSSSSITTTWIDNDGMQPASGFLVFANTSGAFTNPVDGIDQTDDNDLSDGSGQVNVGSGVQTYVWNNGLSPLTTYNYKIYAYNGSGTTINYKTDGTVPEDNATTDSEYDNDSKADYTGITQPSPSVISSLADTDAEAVNAFNFNITDLGTSDALPTNVTRIVVKPGPTNDSPWSTTLAGAKITTTAKAEILATVTITDLSIIFDLTTPLEVIDGTSEEILFSTWLVSDGSLTDYGILEFGIDGTDHGFLADANGSQFADNFMVDSFFDVLIDIEIVALELVDAPSEVTAGEPFGLGVKAADENGNVDVDASGDVTLTTEVGSGLISSATGLTQTLSGGTYTWPDIIYPNPGDDELKIRATYSLYGYFTISDYIDVLELVTLIINEVDADTPGTDALEFIELYDGGFGNTDLTGFVIVLYNGSGDISYDAIDLDGYSTDANGYFVIGSSGVVNVDLIAFTTNGIQNGADAVALYQDDATTFPSGTAVTLTNLVDALVYDTDDSDDAGLLVLLNSGEPQINENWNANKDIESNQRLPNGSGGQRNTSTYSQALPTPGACNFSGTYNWTGTVSSSWNDAGNWDVAIPTNSSSANIPDVGGAKAPFPVISGSAKVVNIFMAAGSTLEIAATGELTVSGTFINNGILTLKSDANGTASLIEISGVNANVERYVTADRWHSVSIPVTAATANSYFGMYLIYYDEPTSTWPYVTEPTDPLGVGVGYSAWSSGTNATVTLTGNLNTGTVSLPLSFSGDYWNSVGNPYPSAIDWDGSGWAKTQVDDAVYVWDGVNYKQYVGGIGNLTGGIIPAQQSFMVRVSSGATAPALSVSNISRVHGVDPYKGTESLEMIKLKVVGNNYSDETFIALNSNSTFDFDGQYDAYKLMGIIEAPQLYSVAGEDNLSINSIPEITKGLSIPLNFKVGQAGIYEITLNEINGFDNVPVFLEDLKEHKVVDLKANNLYKCEAFPSDDPMRFLLHFSYEESPYSNELSDNLEILIVPVDKTILISSEKAINGMVKVYNLLGQEMESLQLNNITSIQIPINSKPGYYIVRVQSENGVTSRKLFVK